MTATVSAHTPGPWFTEYRKRADGSYGQDIFDASGECIATCAWYPVKISETVTGTNREANARLIAAAPNLLSAAIEVMAAIEEHGPSIVPHLSDSDQNAGQRLRDAIAKAEGRS